MRQQRWNRSSRQVRNVMKDARRTHANNLERVNIEQVMSSICLSCFICLPAACLETAGSSPNKVITADKTTVHAACHASGSADRDTELLTFVTPSCSCWWKSLYFWAHSQTECCFCQFKNDATDVETVQGAGLFFDAAVAKAECGVCGQCCWKMQDLSTRRLEKVAELQLHSQP